MPSSSEPDTTAPLTAAALIEKIEELSLLRMLNDRMAGAPDFATACRALVDLVWEERRADTVAYVVVDPARRLCRLEAVAPARPLRRIDFALDEQPFPVLLAAGEPLVLDAPGWLRTAGALPSGVVVSAPTRVRGVTTGLLLAYYDGGDVASLEEDARLLAIVAASAALALDAARSPVREEFLATLRHDINNPLNAALGHAEMIVDHLRGAGDRAMLPHAASILESLAVVADLVSNYLSMAAIDRGVAALEYETLDLGALAAETVARVRPAAADKGLLVECRVSDGARVDADPLQLGRVVTNLLSNALKYTKAPGAVAVTVEARGDQVVLAVTDSGDGIAPEDLPAVGTKYARFHHERDIPGTGLGLYISRAIVEAHGGSLTVESVLGHGCTVTVRLPRLR